MNCGFQVLCFFQRSSFTYTLTLMMDVLINLSSDNKASLSFEQLIFLNHFSSNFCWNFLKNAWRIGRHFLKLKTSSERFSTLIFLNENSFSQTKTEIMSAGKNIWSKKLDVIIVIEVLTVLNDTKHLVESFLKFLVIDC